MPDEVVTSARATNPGHSARENDMTHTHDYTARARLFGGNRMKLGVMAFNCSHGSTITTVPEAWKLNWPDTRDIAQAVDRAGMEALLPVGRWKGYGGAPHFHKQPFQSIPPAAAVGAGAQHCTRVATAPVPLVHPLMVAKMAATIDHVTGGRFAMNVVCGWFNRRPHAPARRSLQIRHRMARFRAPRMDAGRGVRFHQRELQRRRGLEPAQ